MKNEIEVGEFIRTDNGYIAKVIENRDELILDKEIAYHGIYKSYLEVDEKKEVIHSKEIKDLIQIGDYINGVKVVELSKDKETGMLVIKTANQRKFYSSKIIHGIVTHEQFSQMEYKVKE